MSRNDHDFDEDEQEDDIPEMEQPWTEAWQNENIRLLKPLPKALIFYLGKIVFHFLSFQLYPMRWGPGEPEQHFCDYTEGSSA